MLTWFERGFSCAPPQEITQLLKRSRTLRAGDPEATNALREHVAIPEHIDELVDGGSMTLSRSRQWIAITAMWARLRLVPLQTILETRRNRAPAPVHGVEAATASLAAGYEAGRSFTPITRNCLLDSLALDSLLARQRLRATLVFGVCPTPFSAHCWLQTPKLILNDTFDHVSRFTPIYAV
jgi:hypothetical protein